jgi:hypothetical protein
VDNEFQSIKEEIEENGVQVHVVTRNEHVPEVEHQNRVIKERSRAIIQTLPYTDLPRKIRIALIKYVVFWLNNTLKENQYMTPREMIMGEQILDCKNICKIPFGSYMQIHEDQQIKNTMESRTTGAICLGPSNVSGGYNFYSLETGEIITRRNWTELPVPMDVISRLKEMSSGGNCNIDKILEEKELVESSSNHENELELGDTIEEDDIFNLGYLGFCW